MTVTQEQINQARAQLEVLGFKLVVKTRKLVSGNKTYLIVSPIIPDGHNRYEKFRETIKEIFPQSYVTSSSTGSTTFAANF